MAHNVLLFNKSKIKIFKILERTGILLKVYRSGKTPKVLKLIPLFINFEEIIWFTRPDRWSLQALFVVSRLFSNSLNNIQQKRFYSLIILPRLQEFILNKNKFASLVYLISKMAKLNHRVFFSAIAFPLLSSSSCSKKEAVIFSIIIMKISFQTKHIAWILAKLLRSSQTSIKSIFLRAIFIKNYNFPYRILDNLVDYFIKNQEKMNEIYFLKCYGTFLEKYISFLSLEDKNRLPNTI